jgi:hypothetical protein
VFRKQLDKYHPITGPEITPKFAEFHSITTKGLPLIKEYPMLHVQQLRYNQQGNLSINKKKHLKGRKLFKNLGKVVIFIGGIVVGKNIQMNKATRKGHFKCFHNGKIHNYRCYQHSFEMRPHLSSHSTNSLSKSNLTCACHLPEMNVTRIKIIEFINSFFSGCNG